MAITPYTGQPLAKGMIVCRRSVMTNGICSRPVMIVRVRGSRLYVRPWGEHDDDASAVGASTVVFVCDTWEDGQAMSDASAEFLKREQERLQAYERAKAERQADIIRATIESRA